MTKKVQVKALYELVGHDQAAQQSISLDWRWENRRDPEHSINCP